MKATSIWSNPPWAAISFLPPSSDSSLGVPITWISKGLVRRLQHSRRGHCRADHGGVCIWWAQPCPWPRSASYSPKILLRALRQPALPLWRYTAQKPYPARRREWLLQNRGLAATLSAQLRSGTPHSPARRNQKFRRSARTAAASALKRYSQFASEFFHSMSHPISLKSIISCRRAMQLRRPALNGSVTDHHSQSQEGHRNQAEQNPPA